MSRNNIFIIVFVIAMITVAIYFGVHIYSKVTNNRQADSQPAGAKPPQVSIGTDETHQQLSDQQTINKLNTSDATKNVGVSFEKIDIDKLKNTNLTLRLWGTITGDNVKSYAIIEDTTTRKQKLYKEDDDIQHATVKMILRAKVVLKVGSNFEILKMGTWQTDVNAKDKYGVTALIDASFKGQKEIVEILILEGADLDAQDNKGDTALMNAAVKGHSEIAELLISNGADVEVRDNLGDTALIDSAKYARETTCEVIAVLIDSGADVNVKNKYGVTALMNAAQWGHIDNIECLIAEGGDVNAKSKSGETALKLAADFEDAAELLKQHGAKE
jgi:hypothetical protein